jgi:hypothetical protein
MQKTMIRTISTVRKQLEIIKSGILSKTIEQLRACSQGIQQKKNLVADGYLSRIFEQRGSRKYSKKFWSDDCRPRPSDR